MTDGPGRQRLGHNPARAPAPFCHPVQSSPDLCRGPLDFSSTATKTQHLSLEAGVTPRGRGRRPKEPLHVNTASLRECVNASVLWAGCEHEYNLRPVLRRSTGHRPAQCEHNVVCVCTTQHEWAHSLACMGPGALAGRECLCSLSECVSVGTAQASGADRTPDMVVQSARGLQLK